MSDNFFGFDASMGGGDVEDGGGLLSEDEEDYDALNDETFGDTLAASDWEEAHEKLAEITELRRQNVFTENGLLCEQVAAYILDDFPVSRPIEDQNEPPPPRPKPRPPPGFTNANTPNDHPLDVKLGLSSLKNVCTVEELERNLIKPPPANSLRLEDLERNLISKPAISPVLGLLRQPPAGFINVPPPPHHHPVLNSLNNQLPKIPPLSPFQVSSPLPPHPYVLPPGLMANRLGSVLMPIPHPMGPGRGPPPSLNLHPIRPQPPLPPEDEYAGLMTPREKNWLASIQLLQLNTNQPFQEDYYYTMYQLRQSGNHGRKINNSLKNARDRDTPTLIKPQYTPLQFENSLGKLQVGSVMAPRKIIDTDIVDSVDSSSSTAPNNKKIKQILLEIEHMYALVLKAEDALSPLNSHPDPSTNPSDIFEKVVRNLTKEDKLRSVLNIRKGKTLVLRILPHTGVSEPLVRNLIVLLPLAAKKDSDQGWLRALPAIRYYLGLCPFSEIIEFATIIKPHVSYLVPNKFGISVIANMIERAEHYMSHGCESNDWLDFMSAVLTQVHSAEVERPVVGIHGPTLARHLSRCPANNQDVVTLQKVLSNMSMVDKK
uniref:Protein PAT1 1 n=3 Tax=Lygus hesperus TaxID=30085 RepID=A0A0K8SK84_LYGHE